MAQAAYYEGNRTYATGRAHWSSPRIGEVQLKISHCGICAAPICTYTTAPWTRACTMPLGHGARNVGHRAQIGRRVVDYCIGRQGGRHAAGALWRLPGLRGRS